ncbi:unnamed protein product, partial [Rotaria sordida]
CIVYTLSSTKALQQFYADYNNSKENGKNFGDGEQVDSEDDELIIETEPSGISFFRERLNFLLENMFHLDIRHYAAVLLHPKYSKMLNCSKSEIEQTHKWVRAELKRIIINDIVDNAIGSNSSSTKKNQSSLFEMLSNSSNSNTTFTITDMDEDADENPDAYVVTYDELNHYFFLLKKTEGESESQDENPLLWWKKHSKHLPKLSILTRQIFSIPATSASVERQFSSAGVIFNDRRTCLSGENLENIILIRSIENQDKNTTGILD